MDAEYLTSGYQGVLCDRCASVSWDTVTARSSPEDSPRQYVAIERIILEFKNRADLHESPCPLCRFLGTISGPPSQDFPYRLQTLDAHEILPRSHHQEETMEDLLLCVMGPEMNKFGFQKWSSFLAKHRADVWVEDIGAYETVLLDHVAFFGIVRPGTSPSSPCAPRIVSTSGVDYGAARAWLAHCRKEHSATCSIDHDSKPIPGFKLISCESGAVIASPHNCKYAALSYVWGNRSADDLNQGRYQATIEDGITVCKELGLEYLWVDKYCINQSDKAEMLAHMQHMGRIYSEAVVTLIAAAGDDPDYGLPGVNTRSRQPQPQVRLGNIQMLEVYLDKDSELLTSSKWATRAWTYQEAVLSPRKLIFTDLQMSYICNESRCVESFHGELSLDDFKNFGIGKHSNPRVMEYIKEYTRRDLTYESDSLNACLGILNMLERGQIRQLWGVPVAYDQDFESGYMMLSWSHWRPASRRNAFPSWSWAGWQGPVEYHDIKAVIDPETRADGKCTIDVLHDDGASESMLKYLRENHMKSESKFHLDFSEGSGTPKRLKITALVVENIVAQGVAQFEDSTSVCALLDFAPNVRQRVEVFMDEKDDHIEWLGLSALVLPYSSRQGYFLLLLRKCANGDHNRVGIIIVEPKGSVPLTLVHNKGHTVNSDERRMSGYYKAPRWWQKGSRKTVILA